MSISLLVSEPRINPQFKYFSSIDFYASDASKTSSSQTGTADVWDIPYWILLLKEDTFYGHIASHIASYLYLFIIMYVL